MPNDAQVGRWLQDYSKNERQIKDLCERIRQATNALELVAETLDDLEHSRFLKVTNRNAEDLGKLQSVLDDINCLKDCLSQKDQLKSHLVRNGLSDGIAP